VGVLHESEPAESIAGVTPDRSEGELMAKITDRTLADMWETYAKAVIPPGESPAAIKNAKFAFYGGASYVLDVLLLVIGDDAVSEDAGIEILEGLRQELRLFAAQQGAQLKPGN